MWFRPLIGILLGLVLLGLGGFLGVVELTGDEPTRWWLLVFAVVPGAIFLAATGLTWALPESSGTRD